MCKDVICADDKVPREKEISCAMERGQINEWTDQQQYADDGAFHGVSVDQAGRAAG